MLNDKILVETNPHRFVKMQNTPRLVSRDPLYAVYTHSNIEGMTERPAPPTPSPIVQLFFDSGPFGAFPLANGGGQ